MKQYFDEDIIQKKNLHRMQTSGNIYDGVVLRGEHMEFEHQTLFDGRIEVHFPKNFTDMPQNLRELKYPMSSRPQIIKTNATGDVNFCFNMLKQEVKRADLEYFTKQMQEVIKRVQTAAVMYDVYYINEAGEKGNTLIPTSDYVEGRNIMSVFNYKLPAIDEPIYYSMIFIPVKEELFQAVFSCCYKDVESWQLIFEQAAEEIRVRKEL